MSAELTDRLGSDGAHLTGSPVTPALLRDLPTSTQDARPHGSDRRPARCVPGHGPRAVTCAAAWLIREVLLRTNAS
ncbi:hypothetical protein ACIHCV_14985 [Streptomyces sp. NPDC051956]|uniref:hypothetical protein n=1 Tax=Streptomyces sp. NPDC051956 TaxID=3365677 RepID=UPI0037CDAA58